MKTQPHCYRIQPLKSFLPHIEGCKYCLNRWRGGGTMCILCSIDIQKVYFKLRRQIEYKQFTRLLYKFVLMDIEQIGLQPNRIMQTRLGDSIHLFGDTRVEQKMV